MAQPPSLLTTDNGLPFGVQGACDSRFTGVIRAFAGLYPGRKFGGGALAVSSELGPVLRDRRVVGQKAAIDHAVTYGWLLSGLARAVTGKGMRELFREELARPLNTDGIHLGRPPADSPTKAAQTLLPQAKVPTPLLDFIAPKVAGLSFSGLLGAVYFPGILSLLQDDMPFLDGEVPAVNGVVTARALAKTYGALANDGVIDGTRLLSSQAVRGLTGKSELWPDLNLGLPFTYHQGYQSSPVPGLLEGYGHIGLGGTIGWADPETGSAFGYVHNRLLTLLLFDIGSFAGLAALLNSAVVAARRDDPLEVPHFGAPYSEPRHEQAASGA